MCMYENVHMYMCMYVCVCVRTYICTYNVLHLSRPQILEYFGASILLGSIIILEMRQAKMNYNLYHNINVCLQAIVRAVANKVDPVSYPNLVQVILLEFLFCSPLGIL